MSYTFRVIFEGVCGFVPDRKFFKKAGAIWTKNECDPPTEVDVLLPDLSRAEYNTQVSQDLRVFRSPHFALLQFDYGQLENETTRRVDLAYRTDVSSRAERGLLCLKREQIRFIVDANNKDELEFAGWTPENQESPWREILAPPTPGLHVPDPTYPDQAKSLWWLPRLDEIESHYDRARCDQLRDHYHALPEDLQSRVEIDGGFLRTFDFNRNVDGEPQPWRFLPADQRTGAGVWNRAIGNRLALEFYDVTDPVKIELKRLGNDVQTTYLQLAPEAGADVEELEVVITNSEPERLFSAEDRLTAQLPDPDFEEFYYMLTEPEDYFEPMPVPNPPGFGLLGISDKPCSPVGINHP